MMKEDNHIFQGMQRDMAISRQKPEFLWDALNIRVTARDGDTLLSITNEKGNKQVGNMRLDNYYVGHCVAGDYLIVFTANDDYSESCIYRIDKNNNVIKLYSDDGCGGWLGLSPNHPLETIYSYETELIQKVYWVDGRNQPRVINIKYPELKLVSEEDKALIVNGADLTAKLHYNDTSFNFVPQLQLNENVSVVKSHGSGLFSPGVIQYAFAYYNRYGQESNIFYTTPLQYISPLGRGGNPEETCSVSFKIDITGTDTQFDCIRVYSIHRTSLDATPTVKLVTDVKNVDDSQGVTIIDSGTMGSVIDPTLLLYIGGREIVANTICDKDGTLFLGGIQLLDKYETFKEIILEDWEPDDVTYQSHVKTIPTESTYYYYPEAILSSGNYARFKAGETYRLGLQVQTQNGLWSQPIFMYDGVVNDIHPWYGGGEPQFGSRAIRLFSTQVAKLVREGAKKIRTCVVFPRSYERDIICQGILCPTVFNVGWRKTDSPYAASSWFFRPAVAPTVINNSSDVYHGASIQYVHNKPLFTGADRGAEIQNMVGGTINKLTDVTSDNVDDYSSHFFVDENIVTFHSPDVEFDQQLWNIDWSNTQLHIMAIAVLNAISGDIDIQTKSSTNNDSAKGFNRVPLGYQTHNLKDITGGLVAGPFYEDSIIKTDHTGIAKKVFMVYPWHRVGSLNNDDARGDNDSARSSELSKKKISNLKFFPFNRSLGEYLIYSISTPQVFHSDEVSMIKLHPKYLNKDVPYYGNVDTLIASGKDYTFYATPKAFGGEITAIGTNETIHTCSDAVRMKYKSTPHMVFALEDGYNNIPLLPRHASFGNAQSGSFSYPDWQNTGSSDGSNDDRGSYDGDICSITKSTIGTSSSNSTNDWSLDLKYHANWDGKFIIYWRENIVRIARVFKMPNGTMSHTFTEDHTGLILRLPSNQVVSNVCDTYLPPGTTRSDFSGSGARGTYIGATKYYKLDKIGAVGTNGVIPYYSLTEVSGPSQQQSRAAGPISYTLSQHQFGAGDSKVGPYMLIGELVRNVDSSVKFGGTSESAKLQNVWYPSCDPIKLVATRDAVVPYQYGDTWYSRYDCLKTYPFTQEDENSIVEIGSFMVETRVNIDGRYDRNRGQLSNLNMTPQNFNLINPVYSQPDNFFNYRILDEDFYRQNKFFNQITWSKEKMAAQDTDAWTNITLASVLDMNGNKGKVVALRTYNDQLLCFQERGISQVLFNSRVQTNVSDGVPIELSNNYKVDGYRVLTESIGCQNKFSISSSSSSSSLYFVDDVTDTIWAYNGQFHSLSDAFGLSQWMRKNHPIHGWHGYENYSDRNSIRTFYDEINQDVYFVQGPAHTNTPPLALVYSEKLGQFTSFMDYGGTPAMFNWGNKFYSLYPAPDGQAGDGLNLWENFAGKYNQIYGHTVPWNITFISNLDPTYSKIFDTIECRMDIWSHASVAPHLQSDGFFDYIRVQNEYQDTGDRAFHSQDAGFSTGKLMNSFKKKFRVWRAQIPRNQGTRQRIINPWAKITVGQNAAWLDYKVQLHDISVKYTV